jgi:vacuolar-type H+-ATPase subunit E/Vma4
MTGIGAGNTEASETASMKGREKVSTSVKKQRRPGKIMGNSVKDKAESAKEKARESGKPAAASKIGKTSGSSVKDKAQSAKERAREKAAGIVRDAQTAAAAEKAAAEKAAADYAARAAETIRQSARDTLLKVESSVTAMLAKLLLEDVSAALADPATLGALVSEAVKGVAGPAEVALPPTLAKELQAQLAAKGEWTVVTDETLGTGFSVREQGGRIEHAFTAEAIADEIAKRLRPDLAALLK